MTNSAEPVMASGSCPLPPKYTAAAMQAAAATSTPTTADCGGFLAFIPLFYAIGQQRNAKGVSVGAVVAKQRVVVAVDQVRLRAGVEQRR